MKRMPVHSHSVPRLALLTTALWAAACAGGSGGTSAGDAGLPTGDGSTGGFPGGGGSQGFEPSGGSLAPPGGNHRPELSRVGDREVEVGQALEIQLEATDPDGDALTFSVRSSLPDGAKFEKESGLFTWTPSPEQQGTLVLLTFDVADPEKLRDQETIQITVVAPGQGGTGAPVLDPVGDQAPVAGRPFALQLEASDPNGDPITFSMRDAELLTGATLDAEKGLFEWTPGAELAGQSFQLTFAVSDGTQEASEKVNLVVRGDEPNGEQDLPPQIRAIEDREVRVGETIDIVVEATDERPESLTFELVTPPPEGATFDAAHAHFVWTPTADQVDRAYRLVFRVSDGTYRAIETVTLTVLPGEGGPAAACTADAGEPNANEQAPLAPDTPETRSICEAGDVDTFAFDLQAGDGFQAEVAFVHAEGDLDIVVLGPEGSGYEVVSDSTDDDEQVSGTAPVAGTYLLGVVGYQDATNPRYVATLRITPGGGPGACAPPDDAAEAGGGNDDAARAAPLRDFLGQTLQVCPGNADFYAVDLTVGQRVSIAARFTHADGDIDTELTGPDDFRRASGSADDDEEIVLDPVPATGRYVLRVFGYQDAANAYTLELTEEAAAPCNPDRVEPNDTRENAEPFPPEAYNGMSWCGEPDWYKTQTGDGEALQVYISFDEAIAPFIRAFTPAGVALADTDWESVSGDGCRPARAGCRRLTVRPDAPGWVHWQVVDGTPGMTYDLTVRLQAGAAGGMCSPANQSCTQFEVCDYPNGRCEASYCDDQGFECPGDYLCHQSWCVELCANDLSCSRDGFACKMLSGLEMCGLEGAAAIGDSCWDFTDCAGSLDCLNDPAVPGGYCSRECTADNQCAGGSCATFGNGNFCGKRCAGDGDCRDGYICGNRPAAAGGANVRVCEPAP